MANLVFLPIQQGSEPAAVLMLLHGIGANERSVTPIASGVDPRLTVISVRAPLTMGPTSFAWYPTHFGPNGPVIDADDAEQGRQALLKFIEDYRAEHNVKNVYLMGFSQGAIMAVTAALSAPSLVQASIGFSGRFPEEFASVVRPQGELAATRIWIGHGTEDTKLPIHLGRLMRDSLAKFGAIYDYSEYSAGHEVTPEMLANSHRWLTNQIDAAL
jgi:phospholipase/carboxylesterase